MGHIFFELCRFWIMLGCLPCGARAIRLRDFQIAVESKGKRLYLNTKKSTSLDQGLDLSLEQNTISCSFPAGNVGWMSALRWGEEKQSEASLPPVILQHTASSWVQHWSGGNLQLLPLNSNSFPQLILPNWFCELCRVSSTPATRVFSGYSLIWTTTLVEPLMKWNLVGTFYSKHPKQPLSVYFWSNLSDVDKGQGQGTISRWMYMGFFLAVSVRVFQIFWIRNWWLDPVFNRKCSTKETNWLRKITQVHSGRQWHWSW